MNPAEERRDYFKFLGTAGARFVVAKQLRSSAGIYLNLQGKHIMMDPGPGALVRSARVRPKIDVTALDAIILTHAHIDHTSDANVLIDGMTLGGLKKRGMLFAPDECINGDNRVILKYLRNFLAKIEILKARKTYRIGKLAFRTSMRLKHSAETYGLIFNAGKTKLSFIIDTKFFPELIDAYRGSDILVMNVVRSVAGEYGDILHLTLDDARRLIREIRPKRAFITHLGMTMLKIRPYILSAQLTQELGIPTTIATDGLTVYLN